MVRAPLDCGGFGAQVLVGNFGDGHISAFDSDGLFGKVQAVEPVEHRGN
jgi:hypothetical protein